MNYFLLGVDERKVSSSILFFHFLQCAAALKVDSVVSLLDWLVQGLAEPIDPTVAAMQLRSKLFACERES